MIRFKKIFRLTMLTIISVVVLIIISVFIFFQTAPQIGKAAEGERLKRMQSSSNFEEGKFQNTVTTNMDMPFKTVVKVVKEQFFGDKTLREPQRVIATRPFNAKDFESLPNDTMAITWFGHSSILIRIEGKTILTDPVLVGERASMFSFLGPKRFNYDHHVTLDELPKIDMVLISHDHYDHLDYPTIKELATSVEKFYVPLGVGAHMEHWGVPADKVTELNWWDEIKEGELTLALTPTRHFSGRAIRDRFKTLWGSWAIIGSKKRIYFSGDSGYFPGFKEIGEKYGPFDLTFMECGAYNEGWSEIHMFPEETAQAHLDVQGKILMPIHWGKFDLSLHPWKESVQRLQKMALEENIELFTPEVGRTILLSDTTVNTSWWENYQ
ncbi:MAG: MBL fold metallo-hydrolase [Cyclobacteriaceae bacterium]